MRKLLCTLGLFCAIAAGSAAQQHDHDRNTTASALPAAAQYGFKIMVDAESGVVKATMDLAYTGEFAVGTQSLVFSLPQESGFHLDSILWRGTPVDSSRIVMQEGRLLLTIPITSGETVPLLFSFETRIDGLRHLLDAPGSILVDDWYPRLLTGGPADELDVPEIGDFHVDLRVTRPLSIAAPGTWVNEIEQIGSIPDRADTILTDLYARGVETHADTTRPSQYLFRMTGSERFSFAVLNEANLTRIMFDRHRLDLFSADRFDPELQHKFILEIERIARATVKVMGTIPDGRHAVLVGRQDPIGRDPDRLAFVSAASRNSREMLTSFAWELISQYFNRAEQQPGSLAWSEGGAIWLTASVLHDLYGDDGYRMVEDWLERQLPPRDIRQPMGSSPFAFMDNLRRPNRPLSSSDSTRFERLFVAPSALQLIAAGTSDEAVTSLLRRYSLASRHRHPTTSELVDLVATELGEKWRTRLAEFQGNRKSFDWSLEDVHFERSGSGFLVTVSVGAVALQDQPVEIAMIAGSDTVIAAHTPIFAGGKFAPFEQQISFLPSTIILDPGQRLPDRNRQNNIFQSNRVGLRYQKEGEEFPTFRRLVSGD